MLKKSEFFSSRKVWVLLGVELFLLLVGIAGLFGRTGIVAGREETDRILGEGIALPAGVYTARVYYETQEDSVSAFYMAAEEGLPFKTLLGNAVVFYTGLSVRECQFYLGGGVEQLRVAVDYNGASTLQIQGIEIVRGTEGSRIFLFWTILLCLALDGCIVVVMYHRRHHLSGEKQLVLFGIPAVVLLCSLPVFVDYNVDGADLSYHLMRIEALAQRIGQGETTRTGSLWLAGHGYASSLFYSDTFLVFPALLRVLGFDLSSVYRMYIAAVNCATAWIAYMAFYQCFRSRYVGMFGCVLYTLLPYRLFNIYNRAAVGEYTAMIFLPLLAWGFYRIYMDDPKAKGYGWNWIVLTAGFSGVIQSHVLTCEMAGMFTLLLCLVLWKKTFRWGTFRVLSLTVLVTAAVNAWFLVPFLDMMVSGKYYFGYNAERLIQSWGGHPAYWLNTLQAAGTNSHYTECGMVGAEPLGIGMGLLLSLGVWGYLCFRHRGEVSGRERRQEKRAAGVALALGSTALFMSTCYFPWDALSRSSPALASLVGALQFPTRFTGMAGLFMVTAACITGKWLLQESWKAVTGPRVMLLLGAVAAVFACYQMNDTLLSGDKFLRLYSAQNLGHSAVLGAEYLPEGAELAHMKFHYPVLSEGMKLTSYEKKGLRVEALVDGEGYIEFPLLYYKGYEARVADTGEKFTVAPGDNMDVRVLFPEAFSGKIQVRYSGMWYWHVAGALSILVCVLLAAGGAVLRRKCRQAA